MAKRGPKNNYEPWMCDVIIEVAKTPGNYKAAMLWEIGQRLGKDRPISPDTFARWMKENPEFKEAWDLSQIISQAIDEKELRDIANGTIKGNVKAYEILFRAKYRNEYSTPYEGQGATTINNNLLIENVENLSIEELKYRMQRVQESLAKTGYVIEHQPEEEQEVDCQPDAAETA